MDPGPLACAAAAVFADPALYLFGGTLLKFFPAGF